MNVKEDFDDLPITYVIFITENDVRGENRPLYHFEWKDTETGKPLGDGAHIVYVNAAYNNEDDNSDIAKLMHDFRCSDPSDMNFELLASKAKFFKETEEGVKYMCKINEDMVNEAKHRKAVENATTMILDELPLDKAAKYSGLTIEEVTELAADLRKKSFD